MSNFGEPTRLNWGAPQTRSRTWPLVAVGLATFAAGGLIVGGFLYWKSQNDRMSEMTALLTELRNGQVVMAPQGAGALLPVSPVATAADTLAATNADIATRDVANTLMIVTGAAAAATVPSAAPVPAEPQSFLANAASAPAPAPSAMSAADQIRALVEQADPAVPLVVTGSISGAPAAAVTPVAPAPSDLSVIARTVGSEEAAVSPSAADRVRYVAAREAMTGAVAETSLERDEARLAVLSEALNGVREIAGRTANGQYTIQRKKEPGQDIQPHFVVRGYEQEQIALIDLLQTAAQNDVISYPSYVVNASGTIDGAALLLSAVQEALAEGTTDERWAGERLAIDIADVRAAETYVVRGERFYEVLSGDSLAFIALQFYGTTNSYSRIFEANRDVIDSPERIRIGQRLRIPY